MRVCVSVCEFRVCIRRTKASDRCRLKGDYLLRADVDALLLIDLAREAVLSWPYRYLRRFGRDKVTHHTNRLASLNFETKGLLDADSDSVLSVVFFLRGWAEVRFRRGQLRV